MTAADDAGRMPPPAGGRRLTDDEVAKLRRWIRQGAAYAEHWAFVPPQRPAVPAVSPKWWGGGMGGMGSMGGQSGTPHTPHTARTPTLPGSPRAWVRNPIDAFVLARAQRVGLKPSPQADRFALLRRVSLDLRGLPPTPEEVDAFARDTSADAYEKAVDRFLNDPAYGERWARMWLDLARYADSAGYGSDPLRTIWPYRDWVIDAFNRNLPYDQFTIEQIAGDLVWARKLGNGEMGPVSQFPNFPVSWGRPVSPFPRFPVSYPEAVVATAFNRNTMTNTEGGTDREEFRVAAVRDRVDTTMQVWMGLTMGCAKCHNHKYDPITQKEYYQFFAFFNQTEDNDQPDERPTIKIPYPPIDDQIRQADEKIAALKKQLETASKVQPGMPADSSALQKLRDEIARLEKSRPAPATVPVIVERPPDKRRESYVLIKSNFLDRGEKVEAGVPKAFHPFPKEAALDRLGVAMWLVDPRNPLTARVAVNRFWSQLFGTGIVETEEDFGTQGAAPSHPELLDWLAVGFASGGHRAGRDAAKPWDIKALLRLMVTSATYRQSSRATSELLARDPRNRLLARGPRHRLEAEMVRDQALALSGLLSRKLHGPSVYPPQPPGLWQPAFNGQRTWPTSTGEDRYRRGIYTFWRRTVPYPSMTTFDAPSREFCVVRRVRTNTPLQAFVTLNDPVFVESSQALARRIVHEGGATGEERARYGLRLCLCRPPEPAQVHEVVELFQTELQRYRGRPEEAKALATDPLGPLPDGMDAAELAAWTVVANVLLNLDGVLAKG